ncbi:hypothetical protein Syun_006358 [Stephania yunnanensis]|uniref:Uncharacterized protein n=1 Tax=Stephania yunnanensis TaxID=152371 RepID=A0AAP0KWE5_9MAGN
MDIDLLCSLGGWFLGPYFMATPTTKTKPLIKDFTLSSKTLPFLALLGLIFIVLLFMITPTSNQFKLSNMSPSFPYHSSRRSLILSSSMMTLPPSTAKFHRRKETYNRSKRPRSSRSATANTSTTAKQFNESAHEVPSGENPVSNR